VSIGRVLASPLIGLIRLYQNVISPMRPPTCRYYPSCSAYAVTALQTYGVLRGSAMATRRLLRCHPWSPGGVDHVPLADPGHRSADPGHYRPSRHRQPQCCRPAHLRCRGGGERRATASVSPPLDLSHT
jgi:putative membrane protein insertion efficiency factor